MSQTQPPKESGIPPLISIDPDSEKAVPPVPGIFSSYDSTRLSILNGSHKTVCTEELETVLVLPDFTMVVGVPPTLDGAKELWRTALDSELPRMGLTEKTSSFQTFILPYSVVIMLCEHFLRLALASHSSCFGRRLAQAQRQPVRDCCTQARAGWAPFLQAVLPSENAKFLVAFIKSLESKGWSADTQLEPIMDLERPLEQFSGTADEKANHITDELKALPVAKKALILRNSHMGGHRYAGNLIIYTPQGSSVWYGRVTTHEVESIVVNTLEGGLVLPPLLRGGMDLARPGCQTLHDW